MPSIYPWGHTRRFNAYSNYFKARFGERVQKVSLNAGLSCPNRDGRIGTGGCTYCDNAAFNPSYCDPAKSIAQQIEEGILFHQNRYHKANRYLAYFQAYSNTYGDLEHLKHLYEAALENEQIIGLVIGTRPDCMDEKKLDYFARLSEKYYIMLEYGIESCNDESLRHICRGHDFETAVRALELTKQKGLPTGAHFIFGLPGETPEEWMKWPEILAQLPINTLKFHQLQIIKNTRMAEEYVQYPERFADLSFDEYIHFMVEFLEKLRPEFIIERFAGEVPPRFLLVQQWESVRNEKIVQIIEKQLEERNTWQGRLA